MDGSSESKPETTQSSERWKRWVEASEQTSRLLPPEHPLWWYRAVSYEPNEHVQRTAALIPHLLKEPIDWIEQDLGTTSQAGSDAPWLSSCVAEWPRHLATLLAKSLPVNGAAVLGAATATLRRLVENPEAPLRRMRLLLLVNSLLRSLRTILEALTCEDWTLLGASRTTTAAEEVQHRPEPLEQPRQQVAADVAQLLDRVFAADTFADASGIARLQSQLFKLAELVVLSFTFSPVDWSSRSFSGRDAARLADVISPVKCQEWVEQALSRLAETPAGASFVPLLTRASSLASIARRRAELAVRTLVPLYDVAFKESLHVRRISQKQSIALNMRILFLCLLRCPHMLPFKEELYAALELFGAEDQAEAAANTAEECERQLALQQGSVAPWSRVVQDGPTCRQLEDSEQVARLLVTRSAVSPASLEELVLETLRQMPTSRPIQAAPDDESSRMDPRLRAQVLAAQQSQRTQVESIRKHLKTLLAEEVKRRRPVIRAQAPEVRALPLTAEQWETLGEQAVRRLLQAEDAMELCGANDLRLSLLARLLAQASYGESSLSEEVVDFIVQDFSGRMELALRWLTALVACDAELRGAPEEPPRGLKRSHSEIRADLDASASKRERLAAPWQRDAAAEPDTERDDRIPTAETLAAVDATNGNAAGVKRELPAHDHSRDTDDKSAPAADASRVHQSASANSNQAGAAPKEAPNTATPEQLDVDLDESKAKRLTVAALRAELARRHLDAKGTKKVLLERLLHALAEERQRLSAEVGERAASTDAAVETSDASSNQASTDTPQDVDKPVKPQASHMDLASASSESPSSTLAAAAGAGAAAAAHTDTAQRIPDTALPMLTPADPALHTAELGVIRARVAKALRESALLDEDKSASLLALAEADTAFPEARYERLLDTLLERLTSHAKVPDSLLARFLAELPRVPPWVYVLLSQMATEPRRAFSALAALKELCTLRYSVDRERALDTTLELCCSDDELVRGPASRLVADTLFAEHALLAPWIAHRLQLWLSKALERALLNASPSPAAERYRLRLERLAATYLALVRHDVTLLEFYVNELYARASTDASLAASLQRLCGDRALFRWSATSDRLEALIREAPIPETSPLIVQIVELVAETLFNQTGKLPSSLVDAVWQRYQREGRVSLLLLLPVLRALSAEQARQVLPSLVQQLDADQRRLAWERLVLAASGRTTPPLTPSALVEALHRLDSKSEAIPLKLQIEAVQTCFEMDTIFTAQCWASALQSMVRSPQPLPVMLMRTLLQVVARYPKTQHLILQLLTTLVTERRIWEYPKLWPGFIRACVLLMPQSASLVVAHLPSAVLDRALRESAELREALAAFAEAHAENEHRG